MVTEILIKQPNYKKIYTDLLIKKYPEKIKECTPLLMKDLSYLDIIELNNIIFGLSNIENESFSRKHRSYDKSAIFYILDYQKKHNLNNSQVAKEFKMSRNTINKWKKFFAYLELL